MTSDRCSTQKGVCNLGQKKNSSANINRPGFFCFFFLKAEAHLDSEASIMSSGFCLSLYFLALLPSLPRLSSADCLSRDFCSIASGTPLTLGTFPRPESQQGACPPFAETDDVRCFISQTPLQLGLRHVTQVTLTKHSRPTFGTRHRKSKERRAGTWSGLLPEELTFLVVSGSCAQCQLCSLETLGLNAVAMVSSPDLSWGIIGGHIPSYWQQYLILLPS